MALHTQAESQATIARLARDEFAAHILVKEAESRWRCGRPGTSVYAFNVILAPGLIVVYGDVGDAMVQLRHRNPDECVAWVRSADFDYFAGKLYHKEAFRKFYTDDALAYARDCQGYSEFIEEVTRLAHHDELTEHEWHAAVLDHGLDTDAHSAGDGWNGDAMWTYECLKKFAALFEATQ